MSLRITLFGESVLRETGKKITEFNDELKALSKDMIDTMYEEEGVGLAAQQIGKAILLCVVDVSYIPPEDLDYTLDGRKPPIDLIMPMTLVNPTVQIVPSKTVSGEEGCLSFPGIRGMVARPDAIEVEFQDIEGKEHHLATSGWFARVIQHEVDHLNGRLFIDLMETKAVRNLDSKLKKLKRKARDLK